MKPDFLGIGAQRCGTTAMSQFLRHNAQVYMPRKEMAFWHKAYPARSPEAYFEEFDAAPSGATACGEFTPTYFCFPHVPELVARFLPDCRFLVLLRDPVDRAYSNYHMPSPVWVRNRERAVCDPRYSFTAIIDRALTGEIRGGLIDQGHYAEHLERWFMHFDPSRFLILSFDALRHRPHETVARAEAFLGVEPSPPGEYPRVRGYARYESGPMAPEDRRRLAGHFAPWNRRLARLLGAKAAAEFPWLEGL